MAGLFTLDSASLGVLDQNALGGSGTGFVVGSGSSAGSAVGVVGYSGSVAGSGLSAGSVSGFENAFGSVTGSGFSAGSISGTENAFGSVSGANTSAGVVSGSEGASGASLGVSSNTGSATGSPGLVGSVGGASAGAGSVVGTASGGQPAPAPAPKRGGRYQFVTPEPRTPHAVSGKSTGRSVSIGRINASKNTAGVASGAMVSVGRCVGTSRLAVTPLRLHIDHDSVRRKAEDELLTLGLL